MAVEVLVVKEHAPGERRVAMTPETARKLIALGASVAFEPGAGVAAGFPDAVYQDVGAQPADDTRLGQADIVLCVQPPDNARLGQLKPGASLVGMLHAVRHGMGAAMLLCPLGDAHADLVAWIDVGAGDKHAAIDFWSISVAAGNGALVVDFIDQHVHLLADLELQAGGADGLLVGHETVPAILFDVIGYRVVEQVGGGAFYRRVLEAAHAVELGFGQPVEQVLEVFFGFAGEADDKGRADGQLRADLAPVLDPRQGLVFEGWALHGLEHFRAGVLEGDVQVRQDLARGHQRDDVVDVRVWVDVVQAHPDAHAAERFAHFQHAGFHHIRCVMLFRKDVNYFVVMVVIPVFKYF